MVAAVDFLTGDLVYQLKIVDTVSEGGAVLYTWTTSCSADYPITALDYNGKMQAQIAMAGSATKAVLSGVETGANLIGGVSQMTGTKSANFIGPLTEKQQANRSGSIAGVVGQTASDLSRVVGNLEDFGNALVAYKSSKIGHAVRSGSIGGSSAFINVKYPYLIITRPKQNIPESFGHEYGFKSHITARLGDLTGFTKVESIHLEGPNRATELEKNMIEEALVQGVYL